MVENFALGDLRYQYHQKYSPEMALCSLHCPSSFFNSRYPDGSRDGCISSNPQEHGLWTLLLDRTLTSQSCFYLPLCPFVSVLRCQFLAVESPPDGHGRWTSLQELFVVFWCRRAIPKMRSDRSMTSPTAGSCAG
jgi:hypothetical protein